MRSRFVGLVQVLCLCAFLLHLPCREESLTADKTSPGESFDALFRIASLSKPLTPAAGLSSCRSTGMSVRGSRSLDRGGSP